MRKYEIKKEIEDVLRNLCAGHNYRKWSTDVIDENKVAVEVFKKQKQQQKVTFDNGDRM